MIFGGLIKNYLVKSNLGFWPNKKMKGTDGITIYGGSLTLLATVLIKHARKIGQIDEDRAYVLERVHGHFNEHIMFTESPASEALGVFFDMNQDYDQMQRSVFESQYEQFSRDIGPMLPKVVRKEIVAHLAFFQRVDTFIVDNLERESSVRDLHALLLGSVNQKDIQEVMNAAAGYTIDHR
jgi:hypothetical protein